MARYLCFLLNLFQDLKNAGRADRFGELTLVHRLDLGAKQKILHRHTHLLADVGGDDFIIASQYLDIHVQAMQPLQCLCSGVFRRVEEVLGNPAESGPIHP